MSQAGPINTAAQPLDILLVGGDEKTARLVDTLGDKLGAHVDVTRISEPEHCAEHCSAHPPEAVIIDLPVPIEDVNPFVHELCMQSADCVVVVLADPLDHASALAALETGAQEVLQKSDLTADKLARAVQYALSRKRTLRMLRARIEKSSVEEERFRTIVQNTSDAIVIVDHTGAICFANSAAELLFGRSSRELMGSTLGSPVVAGSTAELEIVRSDGTVAIAELKAADTVWNDEPAIIASLRDVTERHLMEERERTLVREQAARGEAEASERKSRFLAEAGIVLADSLDHLQTLRSLARLAVPFLADWCVVDVLGDEGSMQRVAVVPADPAKEDSARRLAEFSPERSLLTGAARALRTGQPELIAEINEAQLQRVAFNEEHLEALRAINPRSAMVIPLIARGRTLGSISLLMAESGRRYNERDVQFAQELARRAAIAVDNARLYQEAQLANKSKADFLAIMSHELRTPLNAVIGYSDLLLMGVPMRLPNASQSHVERIRGSARHLLRLIEEILTYARMEAGREHLTLDSFDAVELVAETAAMVEPLANDKQLTIKVDTPNAPIRLHTDAGKLQQILLNLLTNAVKFTDSGHLGITFDFDGGIAQFTVWDTGIGIPAAMRERIFEPFWQAEQTRTRRAEGTGLGLTVARRLARLLGGDIELESTPGVGTKFRVRVPPSIALPPE